MRRPSIWHPVVAVLPPLVIAVFAVRCGSSSTPTSPGASTVSNTQFIVADHPGPGICLDAGGVPSFVFNVAPVVVHNLPTNAAFTLKLTSDQTTPSAATTAFPTTFMSDGSGTATINFGTTSIQENVLGGTAPRTVTLQIVQSSGAVAVTQTVTGGSLLTEGCTASIGATISQQGVAGTTACGGTNPAEFRETVTSLTFGSGALGEADAGLPLLSFDVYIQPNVFDSTGNLQIAGPLTKVGTLTTNATGQATTSFPVVTVTIPGATAAPTAIAVSLVPSGAAATPSFYINAGLGGGTANIAIAIAPLACG